MAGCAGADEAAPLALDEAEELILGDAIGEVSTVPPSPEGMILADSFAYVAAAVLTRRSWTTRRTLQTAG